MVNIITPIDNTIIYLDPPYKNTAKYNHDINHNKLLDWIIKSPYKIYVSSYEFEGLYECLHMNHRSKLSSSNNHKIVIEKLFCNKPEFLKEQLSIFEY